MTYEALETSASSGAPVELYEFLYTSNAWRYTSSDEVVTIDGRTFLPLALTRSAMRPSMNKDKGSLNIVMPLSAGLSEIFRVSPPGEEVVLTIYRFHRGDAQKLVVWSGRVLNAKFDEVEMELSLESVMSAVNRAILTRSYQKGCPHLLYGVGCRVDPTPFKVTATAATITGNIIGTLLTPADGYYAGGVVTYVSASSNVTERRFIVDNTAGALTLDRPAHGLLLGMTFEVLPGCKHTLDDCKNKFNNVANYGGQPFIPSKNPAGGAIIY